MNNEFYNNIGICSSSIIAILEQFNDDIDITKIFLIMPIISHKQLLNHLSHASVKVLSLDGLIIDKNKYFSNFNKRFYQSLPLTLNTLQFLNDIEIIQLKKNKVRLLRSIPYDKKMGKRVNKIYKSAKNIATVLNESNEKLYLNLRIEL
jgi:hypothetical protein